MNRERLAAYAPIVLSILRIVAALVFMQHGFQKLFEFPDAGHSPGPYDPFTLSGVAGLFETFGGFLLLIGLFTRPVAFLLSGQMAVAFWYIHVPRGLGQEHWGFFPVVNGGDAAVLFCFVFFYIFFAGPGPWSVDGMREAKRTPIA